MSMTLPDALIALERAAWAELQKPDNLPAARAAAVAVQAAITAHAAQAGIGRYALEMAVKAAVRHG